MPSKDKYIRKMFKARDGYCLIGLDYSQQEVRVLAEAGKEEGLKKAYEESKDIYSHLTSIVYHLPYEQCLEKYSEEAKIRRKHMKAIVLGINYGKTTMAIAKDLGISQEEAENLYNVFFKEFPNVRTFMNITQDKARRLGYVETLWGRKRHLPNMQLEKYEINVSNSYIEDFDPFDFTQKVGGISEEKKKEIITKLNKTTNYSNKKKYLDDLSKQGITIKENTITIQDAERQCVNSVIQGTAGDLTKLAMNNVNNNSRLKELDFHLLLTIHDEVIGECPIENAKECKDLVYKIMVESPLEKIKVPMKCDVEITKVWTGEELQLE